MLDFENHEPIVHFDILTVRDGDTRFWSTAVRMLRSRALRVRGRTEIRMPLADYLALVKRSHSLDELRALIFAWAPARTVDRMSNSSVAVPDYAHDDGLQEETDEPETERALATAALAGTEQPSGLSAQTQPIRRVISIASARTLDSARADHQNSKPQPSLTSPLNPLGASA